MYSNPVNLHFLKSFDQLRWTFVPTGLNDTYFIVNARYNEHLCAADIHLDVFNFRWAFFPLFSRLLSQFTSPSQIQRRKVNTVNLNRFKENSVNNKTAAKTIKSCMWKLEQVETGLNRFLVRNLNYGEYLYASSSLLKTVRSRRNVYTWHSRPDSRQFIWYVYCFSNEVNRRNLSFFMKVFF